MNEETLLEICELLSLDPKMDNIDHHIIDRIEELVCVEKDFMEDQDYKEKYEDLKENLEGFKNSLECSLEQITSCLED